MKHIISPIEIQRIKNMQEKLASLYQEKLEIEKAQIVLDLRRTAITIDIEKANDLLIKSLLKLGETKSHE
jgi:hypothetical protein